MTWAIVAGVVALAVLAVRAVFVVPQGQAVVLERRGRFRKVVGAGPHLRVPLLDHERARVDLREHVVSTPLTETVTSGNLASWVTARTTVRIVDVAAAVYADPGYVSALGLAARAELERHLDGARWTTLLTDDGLAHAGCDAVRTGLRAEAGRWGAEVREVDLIVESRVFGAVSL